MSLDINIFWEINYRRTVLWERRKRSRVIEGKEQKTEKYAQEKPQIGKSTTWDGERARMAGFRGARPTLVQACSNSGLWTPLCKEKVTQLGTWVKMGRYSYINSKLPRPETMNAFCFLRFFDWLIDFLKWKFKKNNLGDFWKWAQAVQISRLARVTHAAMESFENQHGPCQKTKNRSDALPQRSASCLSSDTNIFWRS